MTTGEMQGREPETKGGDVFCPGRGLTHIVRSVAEIFTYTLLFPPDEGPTDQKHFSERPNNKLLALLLAAGPQTAAHHDV